MGFIYKVYFMLISSRHLWTSFASCSLSKNDFLQFVGTNLEMQNLLTPFLLRRVKSEVCTVCRLPWAVLLLLLLLFCPECPAVDTKFFHILLLSKTKKGEVKTMAFLRDPIAVITVEPAVQWFPHESTWNWGVWVMINSKNSELIYSQIVRGNIPPNAYFSEEEHVQMFSGACAHHITKAMLRAMLMPR